MERRVLPDRAASCCRAMEDALPSGLLEVCLMVGVPKEQLRAVLQVRGIGGLSGSGGQPPP